MNVLIYANYGILAHEKQRVYTIAPAYGAVISEPVHIILPDSLHPYITESGQVALNPDDAYSPYLLGEALCTGNNDMPLLEWFDKNGSRRKYSPETCGME